MRFAPGPIARRINLNEENLTTRHVAVIGAGPAGLFAARTLAEKGVRVTLINRDVKPGGLAEYGIYPEKETMKNGLRKQFRRIMQEERITYYGNVTIGHNADFQLDDIIACGFDAVLVTVGAQGTKWLGLPGEDLNGVYHAKDLVYFYNLLPPYSHEHFEIGKRVALIGVGNVMLDISHWLIRDLSVDEVIAVARRGPAEVKFTPKEFEYTAANLDLDAFNAELERCRAVMENVGQDVAEAHAMILKPRKKALEPVSNTRLLFDFLASPTRMIGDEDGRVIGLEVEDTTLIPRGDDTKAQGLGTYRVLDVDTVVFCIGDRVDGDFGLPLMWNEFAKNPEPLFPQEGLSYEAYDPVDKHPIEKVFLAGWAREASSGLVGEARKDGTDGARAVLAYMETLPASDGDAGERFAAKIAALSHPVLTTAQWTALDAIEQEIASDRGLPSFKFASNDEMFEALAARGEAVT